MKKVLFALALFASLSSFAQKKEEPKPEGKIEQPKPQLTDSTMIQVVMKYSELKQLLSDIDTNIDSKKVSGGLTAFLQGRAYIIDKPKEVPKQK